MSEDSDLGELGEEKTNKKRENSYKVRCLDICSSPCFLLYWPLHMFLESNRLVMTVNDKIIHVNTKPMPYFHNQILYAKSNRSVLGFEGNNRCCTLSAS